MEAQGRASWIPEVVRAFPGWGGLTAITNCEEERMDWTRVDGDDKGEIRLFALSTCGWCRKTKKLLDELGVSYDYSNVDLLTGVERDQAMKELQGWNPRRSFPTVVVNGTDVVVGFKPDQVRELLGL
jgi:glutaredoxin